MNVLVVEQRPAAQAMFERLLRQAFDPVTVYCEKSLELAKRTARRVQPLNLALLDLAMPGCSGIEAMTEFRHGFGQTPLVVICGSGDVQLIRASLRAGAKGYIPKSCRHEVTIAALQLVAAGDNYVPAELVAYIKGSDQQSHNKIVQTLTKREREVLRLVLDGFSNPEIASELGIALGTVKHHVHAVFEAFGVKTRNQLAAMAARGGVRSDGSPVTDVI